MRIRCRDMDLPLDRTAVMGVLNVTPDSFSDGGLWIEADAAVKHGVEMAAQGAAIIDVGGESTRPGAEPVSLEEELRRVLPVVEGLRAEGISFVSIDTRKPEVARRALEAGAVIVNDTSGEEADVEMGSLVADTGASIFVMHSRGSPATMRSLTDYRDVVSEVRDFLARRTEDLRSQGVAGDSIAIDPGIGFAKTADQSLALLKHLESFASLGYPVLVGTSRKSFMGISLGLEEDQRLEATVASVVWAVVAGARIVRVHDVEPNVRAVRMTEAILRAE
ncbi:MAG: dihydropteroate synthase [Actinomycetota bacterium]|nr:dihydropteroate synthase [Actinomycetota bacterium]